MIAAAVIINSFDHILALAVHFVHSTNLENIYQFLIPIEECWAFYHSSQFPNDFYGNARKLSTL